MSGLDDISLLLGEIKSDIKGLTLRADEDRRERDKEHYDNQDAINNLSNVLAERAAQFNAYQSRTDARLTTLEMLGPIVAGLELTKSKLTALATIGFVVMVALGWVLEAGLKWIAEWSLSHFK